MIDHPASRAFALVLLTLALPSAGFAQQPAAAHQPDASALGGAEDNPAVRAALEWPRTNPARAWRAILALIDLGRPELAKPILEELQSQNLDDRTRAALVGEFGSHRMLQVARSEALAPLGREFAEAAMGAAAAIASDPRRLAQLIEDLNDPSAETRLAARVDLVAAGPAAAKAVLEAAAVETDPARRRALLEAAATFRPLVDGPLVAMLETNDPQLRQDVGRIALELQVRQAAPFLVGDDPAAVQVLERAIAEYRNGRMPFTPDEENHIELWQWHDGTKSLASARYPADEAGTIWASRLALRLAQRAPDQRQHRRLAVLLVAEAGGLMGAGDSGGGSPQTGFLPTTVRWEGADTELVNDVLADALDAGYAHAAVGAIDELARRGDTAVLITADASPSPLAKALVSGHRRVRFAALRALIQLDPHSPFPGSSHVAETLAYFARGAGRREAIVAMPNLELAADVAGKLAAVNIHGEATYFGSDVAQMAEQLADLEMVLLDMDIQRPGVRQALYELRITPASRRVPVALLAADGRLEAAHRLADEHQRVIAVPRPQTSAAVAKIAGRLWDLSQRDASTPEERASQAVDAVVWTAALIERGRTFLALRREAPALEAALYQPATAAAAIDALAKFGTPASQRALVNFAGHRVVPIEARRRAAAAFAMSVSTQGVLLTHDEILAQYAVYNASESADAQTQEVLGSLLDAIESGRNGNTVTAIPNE